MRPSRLTCPLCHSNRARVLYEYEAVLICTCDACDAQFSVSPDPYPSPFKRKAQPPSTERRKAERRLGDRRGKNWTSDADRRQHVR